MGIPVRELMLRIDARDFASYCVLYQLEPWDMADAVIRSFVDANKPIEPETHEDMIAPLVAAGVEVTN